MKTEVVIVYFYGLSNPANVPKTINIERIDDNHAYATSSCSLNRVLTLILGLLVLSGRLQENQHIHHLLKLKMK